MIIKYKNKIIQNGQFLTPQEASVKPNVTYKANSKYIGCVNKPTLTNDYAMPYAQAMRLANTCLQPHGYWPL